MGFKTDTFVVSLTGKTNIDGTLYTKDLLHARDMLIWNTTTNTNRTIHMKTNWRTNNSTMYRFIVEGYSYSTALAIYSDAGGYLYSGTDNIYNGTTNNYATGAVLTQYKSSDGYLTLKLVVGSADSHIYCAGFSLSLQRFNPLLGPGLPTITVYNQTADL